MVFNFNIVWSLVLVFCVIVPFIYATDKFVLVQTASGPIRGKSASTIFDNKLYYAFKGIPYAEPPIGNLRFKVI